MPRILVLVPFPMDADQLALRQAQQKAVPLEPGTELHYRPVRAAPRTYVSQHDYVLADMSMLEAGLAAEEEGYDAVCIDTVSDSGVAALRSLLDIPVIGPGRAMFTLALMLGERFSVLAMWKHWAGLYKKTLTELDLMSRCASVRAIDMTPDNRNLLGGKEEDVFPRLLETAMKCISDDGADVICLGSTTMHQSHAYLAARLPVPVINPGPLSYKMAETALALRLRHSRATYPRPMVEKREMIRAMLDGAAQSERGKPVEKLA
ncbi:MAG: hydrogenase expression protein HupH [Alphaproteobacteria bacterium]|nr:hydrogenase expression protein HupH [Alphaproteobacteria bacterium]